VIGDVTFEEAKSVIEHWFGDWRSIGSKPNTILPPISPNTATAVNVADKQAVQDSVVLGQQLPINRFDPDYYPLQLGNHVLGGGFYATRLYHDLRQVSGYVYTVDVNLDASKTRAHYTVTYGCNPENVSKARALVLRDINQMRTADVSADELHQAKALLLRQIPLKESSERTLALGLLARAEIGLPLDEPIRAAQRYYELTAAQVRAAFAKVIHPERFAQVVRGPTSP
jgi:zinc protease